MGHTHSPASTNKRRLAFVFGLTLLYLAAEVVGGLLTHSLALLADAGHMLTDVAGLGLALFAIRFAERAATPERTYGYYRFEILVALADGAAHDEVVAAVNERVTSGFKITHTTVQVEGPDFAKHETHF